ncbi:PAS domain S-box protein [Methanococcoides sp. SA1]|nr:PAS domain S-box protein [Methanococcoides sp. SA1]
MRMKNNMMIFGFIFGSIVWVFDSLLDYWIFYSGEGTLLELAITNVPSHELYIRSFMFVMFLIFSTIISVHLNKQKKLILSLKESEKKFSQLFKNINVGVALHEIILDENNNPVDFKYLEVNSKYEELTRLKASEVVGKKGTEVIPNLEKVWIERYGKVALTGKAIEINDHSEYLDKYWEVKAFSPKQNQFAVALMDITEEVHLKNAIVHSKKLLQKILDTIPVRVFWKDLNSVYLGCNDLFANDAGLDSSDKIAGKTDFELFDIDSAQYFVKDDKRVISTGISKNSYVEPQSRKDGSTGWLMTSKTPLLNAENEIIGVLGTYNDITSIKRTEQELRAQKEKFNSLFESMTEMVVIHELITDVDDNPVNYKITDCNRQYTKVTGIKKEDAVGKLATEVYGQPIAPYLKEFSNVAITGETYQYETYFEPMDKHFLISVVSPRKGEFATVTSDITQIKQIQEVVKAKNEELENYLYIASHDLRSPLVNIQGFSVRLQKIVKALETDLEEIELDNKEKIFKQDLPKTLDFIFTSVKKMDKLIKGLLQISRTGRVKMNIQKIDMNELFSVILNIHNFEIENIGAQINVEKLDNCYGDSDLLNQLFSNLISNTLKYRKVDETLKVNISSEKHYNQVKYIVTDNGIGIEERHLEKIWNVFFQVQQTSGDGLGLSMVKRIVDKHKGNVHVDSVPEQGSSFIITLQSEEFIE